MTRHTPQRFLVVVESCRMRCDRIMTANTVILCYLFCRFFSLKDDREIFVQSKSLAMVKTIDGFGRPLPNKIMGCMTIVTCRHMMVAPFGPFVIHLIHRVTIFARFWRVTHIRKSLSLIKGDTTWPNKPPDHKKRRQNQKDFLFCTQLSQTDISFAWDWLAPLFRFKWGKCEGEAYKILS